MKPALLLIVLLISTPTTPKTHTIPNESTNWRIGLALTVAQLIPDDAIRNRLLSNQYIISTYAEEPSHWNNTQSHTSKYLLDNVQYCYYALIDAMNKNNWTLISMRFGVLSHWIGDCADPFCTANDTSEENYEIYQEFLQLWSEDIYSDILEKSSTLELKETDNVTKSTENLIKNTEQKYRSIIEAIDKNDTALLLSHVEYLAEEATKTLYAITISAIKHSELATSMRVLERWRWVAIAMILLSVIVIISSEIKKKITRRL